MNKVDVKIGMKVKVNTKYTADYSYPKLVGRAGIVLVDCDEYEEAK